MTGSQRLALVLGLLFLAAGAAATFLPTSPEGASCGTWVSPAWPEDETRELVERTAELGDNPLSEYLDEDPTAIAVGAARQYALCSDALSTRRTVSLVLLGLGVAVPAGVLYVASGMARERD